jgi:beta-phosphoglucomutase-like phosphatase (HAD superfamily)
VREEQREVVSYLGSVLRPDEAVTAPLRELANRYRLAVVSSSAHARLDACFRATGLDDLLPHAVRFSAEDSLPVPTSKPDPAIYAFAGRKLGVEGAAGLAVEDAAAGVRSAVAAGFPTVGNLQFVPAGERDERIAALRDAGAAAIVESWSDLAALVGSRPWRGSFRSTTFATPPRWPSSRATARLRSPST